MEEDILVLVMYVWIEGKPRQVTFLTADLT